LFVPVLSTISEEANLPIRPLIWSMAMGVSLGSTVTYVCGANLQATSRFLLVLSTR
jgi:hypothetical protein